MKAGLLIAIPLAALTAGCGSDPAPAPVDASPHVPSGAELAASPEDPTCLYHAIERDDSIQGRACTVDAATCVVTALPGQCRPGQTLTSPYTATFDCACARGTWSCADVSAPRGFGLVPCPDAGADDAGPDAS